VPIANDSTKDVPPDQHTASFEEVVLICEEFRNTWDATKPPQIRDFLDRVSPEGRPALLRNLVTIDATCRRTTGDSPRVDDYLSQFPSEFQSIIREALLPPSTGNYSSPSTAQHAAAVVAVGLAPVTRLGEYQLVRELGRGGMGVVYEARHSRHGNRVALKTLPSVSGASLHRFKREFRALADLSHPQLVGLHTLEADGGHWFFTMDMIEGVDFLSFVRPGDVLDENRLRGAMTQLAAGIMALHARHIIHRDLKPSNVMVAHDGRLMLLDFGLVAELDRAGASASQGQIAGTPRYMAPEQAAGTRITAATDWYAVGVMLYEALSGTAPFRGTVGQMLLNKQQFDAPPLPTDAEISADLATLCMRLLARDPRERPDALAITAVVSAGSASTAPVSRSGPQLVGRDGHLATLREAYLTLERERDPLTVFISGRSGEGKTALGDSFLNRLRDDRRAVVMSGRCYDRESVPFKALDTLIDALSSHLRSLPTEEAALLMPDDVGTLARVFPVLQRVEVVARATDPRVSSLDEQQVRQRAFRALRSLLGRIGRRSPVVWFIDDLQWGDADSASALFEVLRPPEAPTVMFLGAYRSDETEDSAFLQTWKELQRKHDVKFGDRVVKLAPLSVEECVELVIQLLGRDDEAIRRRAAEFATETRGNPFLLIELVGCFDPETDSFEAIPLHEVLGRKLGRLPVEAVGLLDVVAVSGQALSVSEASRTAKLGSTPMATLTRMRNERLVRLMGPEDNLLIDTYHDRVRETILGHMEEVKRKTLHGTLAEEIERSVGGVSTEQMTTLEAGETVGEEKAIPRVYDLAYHFDSAGEVRKALVYAILAAEQARRQSAIEVAGNNYEIAKRNAKETTNALRFRIAENYSEVLMLLGRYEEANTESIVAFELADDTEGKVRIELLQGELAFKQGTMDRSIVLFERGLGRLGRRVPRTTFGMSSVILREVVIQCWHTLFPWQLYKNSPNSRLNNHILLFLRLCRPYSFQNVLKAIWSHLASMNRAELLPPSPHLAHIYSYHACIMSMLGWHSRGAVYGDRGVSFATQFEDAWIHGQTTTYRGVGCYASARYAEGVASLSSAVDNFEKAGDLWELNLAQFHRGCCYFGLGNLAAAIAQARWVFAASVRLGDSRSMCSSWLWARAMRGNIPFEEMKVCIPCRPDDIMSTVHGTLAEGYWHSFHGRTGEALKVFEQAATIVRQSQCLNSHTILVMPMLAMSLRLHADAIKAKDPQQAEHLLKRANRTAKWATRLTSLFPAAYPVALRERALVLAACGEKHKALKFAERSCVAAGLQKAKYEHSQSLLVRGKLAKELGLPEADEQIRTAEAAIEEIERPIRGAGPFATGPIELPKPDSIVVKEPEPKAKRRSVRGMVVWGIVAFMFLAGATLVGDLAGRSTGYVVGLIAGVITGEGEEAMANGASTGAAIGRVAIPLLLLFTWGLGKLVPPGQQAPMSIYRGTQAALGLVVLGMWMIPAAIGIWAGETIGVWLGGRSVALGVVGGLIGFAIPFVFRRRAR